MWRNIWKSWAEKKGLNNDIVKHEARELEECHSQFFANFFIELYIYIWNELPMDTHFETKKRNIQVD